MRSALGSRVNQGRLEGGCLLYVFHRSPLSKLGALGLNKNKRQFVQCVRRLVLPNLFSSFIRQAAQKGLQLASPLALEQSQLI